MSCDLLSRPHCLVSTDADGRLKVQPEVLGALASLGERAPVVVGVAGLYRTGKSYLMNRLAGANTGFSLGPTIESHTKGIWLWAREHPRRPDSVLLLLDTEGLGDATKGDVNHDNQIFCLAVLLSSVLCYNAKGAIDDNSIRGLQFISEMSNHIRLADDQQDDADLDLFFPHFLYVLRDFHLEMVRGGAAMTADEYLESCLALREGNTRGATDFNQPRQAIRKYFKHRKCFTFDFPTRTSKDLRELDGLPDSQLNEEFLEETERFCEFILSRGPVKCLTDGQPLRSAKMWGCLVESFVESLRDGRVPCVMNAVDSMAAMENYNAVDTAVGTYLSLMIESVGEHVLDEQQLLHLHRQCLTQSTEVFLQHAFHNKDTDTYKKMLQDKVTEMFNNFVQGNEQRSYERCWNKIVRLEKPASNRLVRGRYAREGGYDKYIKDMNWVVEKYNVMTQLGTKQEGVLLEYTMNKWHEALQVLDQERAVTAQHRAEEAERAKRMHEEKMAQIKEQSTRDRARLDAEHQQAMHDMRHRIESSRQSQQQQQNQHYQQALQSRLAEQERLMTEGFQQTSATLQSQIHNLQSRIG